MVAKLFSVILLASIGFKASAQCHYLPASTATIDTLNYNYSGGAFQGTGCTTPNPSYWMAGSGKSITVNFVNAQNYPSFRVWGMNDDDSASVEVNGMPYALSSANAVYDTKVTCGISPGPDGVQFANGKLVGVNTNQQGNYSYQNIQIAATGVTSLKIIGLSGAGWGFEGVTLYCPSPMAVDATAENSMISNIYPNPIITTATIQFGQSVRHGVLKLYDIVGQAVMTTNVQGDKILINRRNLPAGQYPIRLEQSGRTVATGKLVVAD